MKSIPVYIYIYLYMDFVVCATNARVPINGGTDIGLSDEYKYLYVE